MGNVTNYTWKQHSQNCLIIVCYVKVNFLLLNIFIKHPYIRLLFYSCLRHEYVMGVNAHKKCCESRLERFTLPTIHITKFCLVRRSSVIAALALKAEDLEFNPWSLRLNIELTTTSLVNLRRRQSRLFKMFSSFNLFAIPKLLHTHHISDKT